MAVCAEYAPEAATEPGLHGPDRFARTPALHDPHDSNEVRLTVDRAQTMSSCGFGIHLARPAAAASRAKAR